MPHTRVVFEAIDGGEVRPGNFSVRGLFREKKYHLCNLAPFVASSSIYMACIASHEHTCCRVFLASARTMTAG